MKGGFVSISLFRNGEIPETAYQTGHFKKTFNDFQYAENLFEGINENIKDIEEEVWC